MFFDPYCNRPVLTQLRTGCAPSNCMDHVGKLVDERPEFRFRVHAGFRMNSAIEHQPNTTERIGAVLVIVERNDPEPAALEDVVQRALRQRIFQSVVLSRLPTWSYNLTPTMCVKMARVFVRNFSGIVAQAKLVRQNRFHPRAVDQKLSFKRFAFVAGERDEIFLDIDLRNLGLLPHVRAVIQRHRHHVSVRVLAEEMAIRSHWRRERRILVRLQCVLVLALSLVEKTERALHTAGGTDEIAS